MLPIFMTSSLHDMCICSLEIYGGPAVKTKKNGDLLL